MSDPIADLIIQIQNASKVKKYTVTMPYSKVKEAILKVLKDQDFVESYEVLSSEENSFKNLSIKLNDKPFNAERVSKPGRRLYAKSEEIPEVLVGRGTVIVSTSKGVMDSHTAKKAGIGGEVLLKVWE